MLPEILDDSPKITNNFYTNNHKMEYLEVMIVIGNMLVLGAYIFYSGISDAATNFVVLWTLFPVFHVFWWYQIRKTYQQGNSVLVLNSFFFVIQRIVILLMGMLLTLAGIVCFFIVLNSGSESLSNLLLTLLVILFFIGLGIIYLFHGMLVDFAISKFMKEKK